MALRKRSRKQPPWVTEAKQGICSSWRIELQIRSLSLETSGKDCLFLKWSAAIESIGGGMIAACLGEEGLFPGAYIWLPAWR